MQHAQSQQQRPPMQPSDEAKEQQLRLAKQQGDAFQQALDNMVKEEAHGAQRAIGDYMIGYAIEKAEGLYRLRDGELHWEEPREETAHIEVTVRDGADGRFIPGLTVYATLVDGAGREVGTHQQHFLWHPWLFHYGRNWKVPGDGEYSLRIRVEAPDFPRHDKINGKRYAQPVEVEFQGAKIQTGQKKS